MSMMSLYKLENLPQVPVLKNTGFYHRYLNLTLPPGALDGVMMPALRLLSRRPTMVNFDNSPLRLAAAVFAGDHEVAAKNQVSAFPFNVTALMMKNFLTGGAAINVLCKDLGAPLYAVDVGISTPYTIPAMHADGVRYLNRNLLSLVNGEEYPFGARLITTEPALSSKAFEAAFLAGADVAKTIIKNHDPDGIILGEMGIGNTTPATAIICERCQLDANTFTGSGTGLRGYEIHRKAAIVRTAVNRHQQEYEHHAEANVIIQSLGGFEFAALAGAAIECVRQSVFIILDGLIVTSALLPYVMAHPPLAPWIIAGHQSKEPAHKKALETMGLEPLIQLNLHLGEGSGAALAAGLLKNASKMIMEMSTFRELNHL